MLDYGVRQGDVLVFGVPGLPPGLIPVPPEDGRLVLAHGETTGHHHSLALSDRVALFREDGAGGGMFMAITGEPASLDHNSDPVEHTSHTLPVGFAQVELQRVFSSRLATRAAD